MSALIDVETSIPSFYHETRTETQFQAMREWTREWWEMARLRDELVTSTAVVLELRQAPEPKRSEALALIEPVPLLDDVDTVDEIVAVSASGPQSVNPGGSVFLTATPAAGYRVDQWLVNGAPVQNGGTTFTLTEVAADAAVQVTFAAVTFTVRPGSGGGGTISPATEQTVNIGGSVSFTATAAVGYTADQWLVNGAPVQVGGTARTLANVTGNAAVQVTFKRIPMRTAIAREPVQPPGTGHQMRLIFTGLTGATYRVEYADNLATEPIAWQVVGTVAAGANGEFELVDPPPLPARRFYRAVEE